MLANPGSSDGKTAPQLSPVFRCGSCGLQGVTAYNAAVNILRRGLGSGEGGTTGPGPFLDTPLDVASIQALARMRVEIPSADTS